MQKYFKKTTGISDPLYCCVWPAWHPHRLWDFYIWSNHCSYMPQRETYQTTQALVFRCIRGSCKTQGKSHRSTTPGWVLTPQTKNREIGYTQYTTSRSNDKYHVASSHVSLVHYHYFPIVLLSCHRTKYSNSVSMMKQKHKESHSWNNSFSALKFNQFATEPPHKASSVRLLNDSL